VFLFSLLRADFHHNSAVGGSPIGQHGMFGDEVYCIGAFYVSDALGESSEFICKRSGPRDGVVVSLDELSILERFAVKNRQGASRRDLWWIVALAWE
jgi:hypothetical protein